MQSRSIKSALCLAASATVLICATPGFAQSLTVSANQTETVSAPKTLSSLVIEPSGQLVAPAGQTLTLTVNGVTKPIAPGRYSGKIVVTPAQDIVVPFGDTGPYHFRTALYIDNGAYVADKSVAAAVSTGSVSGDRAQDITITSAEENFNGIIVTNKSTYTIDGAKIDFTGNGGNDFAGFGAAIATFGDAKLTINKATIKTRGVVRTALFMGGKSEVWVNDSDITVENGKLPDGYTFSIIPGHMMEAPYGLGVAGNVRATNLIDQATVHYTRTHIRAQGWGALSTDGFGPTRMFAKDSQFEATDSGYGAYANGDAVDAFDNCVFKVADYGLIIGGNGSGHFLNKTVVNSDRIGVMMHQGTGGGELVISGKSVFKTKGTSIQVKGRGTTIKVSDATLSPENGILLQGMENDDPIMKEMARGGGMPGSGPGKPGEAPQIPGGADAAPPPPPPGGGTPPPTQVFSPDIIASFSNVTLKGDIYQAMTTVGNMKVTITNAALTGAISTSKTRPASGAEPTQKTLRTVGEVINDPQATTDKFGLYLTLGTGAKWTVTRTSYLNDLVIAPGATVKAAGKHQVTLMVDGKETPIQAGTFSGAIEVRVN